MTAALTLALACLALCVIGAANAHAAGVIVLGRDGHVRRENDRFISAADSISPGVAAIPGLSQTGVTQAGATQISADTRSSRRSSPALSASGAMALSPRRRGARRPTKHAASQVTVPGVLARLASTRAITGAQRAAYRGEWYAALSEEHHLPHARASQLASVTEMLHDMAARGVMTASRLPVLFLTLERNAQYWKSGPLLGYGQRVMFQGSELEWEYYTGEGIQLQVLGTFGEANGFYAAGQSTWPDLVSLMSEMIPLAVQRGGGLAWEYYFDWEGGSPPWVSAMAEGTALEALTNAYLATHDTAYLSTAHQAMGILQTAPPTGVAVSTALGKEFLQYSFASHTDIINAFLQTLIGLYDYAKVSGDPIAGTLFNQGTAQAQSVLGSFNTGGWSLYQPGVPDDLNYHQLVTGFLQTLCGLTSTPIYCSTAQAFTADLTTPPVITQLTQTARAKHGFRLYFSLNKPAHVGVVLTSAAGRTYLYTSSNCGPGDDYWLVPKLGAGTYSVKLSGTDLAGNFASTTGTVTVSAPSGS